MVDIIKDETKYEPEAPDSDWVKFEEGTTTIRPLSHSIHFKNHYIKKENKSYRCTGDVSTCAWCQKGNKARSRWAYLVYVKDQKVVKVAEVGWSIFGTILELAKDDDYGDPRNYDIKIKRAGTGLDTEYTVIPGRKRKLTEIELELIKQAGAKDIDLATEKLLSHYEQDKDKED